jgi:hypothetical protein
MVMDRSYWDPIIITDVNHSLDSKQIPQVWSTVTFIIILLQTDMIAYNC